MKTNKIKVTFFGGYIHNMQATNKKIQKAGNINEYVFRKLRNVHKIETKRTGKYDKDYKYTELHYHSDYDNWLRDGIRIEATNPEGHEDYTGYGNKTDGKKNRFYLGRSTGFLPIYLEILTSRSHGGGSLYLTKGRTLKPLYNCNRR